MQLFTRLSWKKMPRYLNAHSLRHSFPRMEVKSCMSVLPLQPMVWEKAMTSAWLFCLDFFFFLFLVFLVLVLLFKKEFFCCWPNPDMNYCYHNPCRNGGTCMEIDTGFECICTTAWGCKDCSCTGKFYKSDLQKCQSGMKQNSGNVVSLRSQMILILPNLGVGPILKSSIKLSKCQLFCDHFVIFHLAVCWFYFVCFVMSLIIRLVSIKHSEIKEDCFPNPCQNGGSCFPTPHGFKCLCLQGYKGEMCEGKLKFSRNYHLRWANYSFLVYKKRNLSI